MPARPIPTLYQRRRLMLLLGIHDALEDGASIHDVAFTLMFPRMRPLHGAEWKAAGERRHAHRLIADVRRMVAGEYRRLLLYG